MTAASAGRARACRARPGRLLRPPAPLPPQRARALPVCAAVSHLCGARGAGPRAPDLYGSSQRAAPTAASSAVAAPAAPPAGATARVPRTRCGGGAAAGLGQLGPRARALPAAIARDGAQRPDAKMLLARRRRRNRRRRRRRRRRARARARRACARARRTGRDVQHVGATTAGPTRRARRRVVVAPRERLRATRARALEGRRVARDVLLEARDAPAGRPRPSPRPRRARRADRADARAELDDAGAAARARAEQRRERPRGASSARASAAPAPQRFARARPRTRTRRPAARAVADHRPAEFDRIGRATPPAERPPLAVGSSRPRTRHRARTCDREARQR